MFTPHRLVRFGWNESVSHAFSTHDLDLHQPGRVVRVDRGECDVVTESGQIRARTGAESVCTGDWVTVGDSVVVEVLPRRSAIVRASASIRSESQVLAANVDTVVVVAALDTDVDLGRIERFLALVWESGAAPVVALTKADAAPDVSRSLADVAAIAPGATTLAVSARTGDGLDVLLAAVGGTVALVGQSGAGKSTLANALLGEELFATGEVRHGDHKGRHVTAHRELVPLPGGGTLIDTPGLRGVGLWDAADGIGRAFSEIDALAAQCRFGDCNHTAEPGCAVREAVARDELPQRRLDSYRKLQRENEWMAARTDARLQAERTRQVKVQSRWLKEHYRNR
jgi:ribosome biogenesis GTPase